MELTITESISAITVLLQGFLSFFSPCVLPLLPLYLGYLSGGTGEISADGERRYNRIRVFSNTVCFVIGISFSFFLLGLGMRAVGRFFSGNGLLFSRVGGVVIILFGLHQLGVFGSSSVLMREKRLDVKFDRMAMSPFTAFLMGFVFSFAWTPCVGPTLSSVLLMAASAKSSAAGFMLVGVYTLGFIIPFLLTGLFTTTILEIFGRHRNAVRYTVRISGVLLILMGFLMVTGYMNSITGYLSGISAPMAETESEVPPIFGEETGSEAPPIYEEETENETERGTEESQAVSDETDDAGEDENDKLPAFDFTLTDQYGETHTLSDYRGKIVFLNFWATWCPPCRAEMPDIQALYEETVESGDEDLVILAVAFPGYGKETDEEGIRDFLEENGFTYPTLMDTEASLMLPYYITAYPTTYMIDRDGNVYGYIPGSMTKDIMYEIIRQTKENSADNPAKE